MDKNLAFKTPGELDQLGYYLDELGQVRRKGTNELICGISGRAHKHYLLLLPQYDPATGKFRQLFVDKQTVQECGMGLRSLIGPAGSGLARHAGNLLDTALKALLSKFLPL